VRRPALLPLGVALFAVAAGAAPSGLLAAEVLARALAPIRSRDEDGQEQVPLLVAPHYEGDPFLLASHRSHSSHSSHASHYSSRGGGWYSGGSDSTYAPAVPAVVAKPKPPKPARVSFAAFPGGRIYVDGKEVGHDASGVLRLSAGNHEVRVENRFLGGASLQVSLSEGQTGVVVVEW
jgi:hypothetical protein